MFLLLGLLVVANGDVCVRVCSPKRTFTKCFALMESPTDWFVNGEMNRKLGMENGETEQHHMCICILTQIRTRPWLVPRETPDT